ncbi:uncharacterized protein TNCV_3045851 [Trichonephila clavipes]|uniref:Uncharacterized protein n=1 Tax=Trichonephila clavipes TaxID=2585209 RepID=A0A8X6V581_TRICX|nr:uncharacterized protein TNCV_3045851 [Trichonephila clavipes]
MLLSKDQSCLGDSKQTALRRLNSLWRRLVQDPKILELYRNCIHEYLKMGHMEIVEDVNSAAVYYLSYPGESLNSLQLNGGVIQWDLLSILLNVRAHKFVVTADIKEIFRMVLIDEFQRDLLRIVWKDKIDSPVKIFGLTMLAIDDGDKYALAADVTMSDVYMGNLLTGTDNLESGRKLQEQLVPMQKGAVMELHKWSASTPFLLPDSMCASQRSLLFFFKIKTLGLLWKPHPD